MKAGARRFGAAERGLLPEGRIAGPMPWVIAIMMFLTVLAAAAGLGLAGAASRLNEQIGGRITIQVVEASPRLRAAQAEAAVAALRLLHLFDSLNKLGTTVIVATHDLHLLARIHRAEMLRLDRGQIADPTGALRHPPRRPQP